MDYFRLLPSDQQLGSRSGAFGVQKSEPFFKTKSYATGTRLQAKAAIVMGSGALDGGVSDAWTRIVADPIGFLVFDEAIRTTDANLILDKRSFGAVGFRKMGFDGK